jgi:ABC-type nitrate/sulfonate/bicarbonate transport system substrate-binding protein
MRKITRRDYLAGSLAALGAGAVSPAIALDTARQGYQTNIWGMPTYYLLRSGLLEKHGVKFEEFAVPSGNLTMQQMVARQVDLGTYAGQSFIIGHDKGGLVIIAQIETVGKTAQIVVRKDLNASKVADLKGLKVANQTGSSVGNIFVDIIAPAAGLRKGDFQEVRMDVNNMIAAMAAKTVDPWSMSSPITKSRWRTGSAHPSWIFRPSTKCLCSWRRHPISWRRAPIQSSPTSRPGMTRQPNSRTIRAKLPM